MPSRTVLQPNGLLAVFSSIVDNFTVLHATRAQVVEYYLKLEGRMSKDDAEAKTQRGFEDEPEVPSTLPKGQRRWAEAIDTIRAVHGEERARERDHAGRLQVLTNGIDYVIAADAAEAATLLRAQQRDDPGLHWAPLDVDDWLSIIPEGDAAPAPLDMRVASWIAEVGCPEYLASNS